MSMDPIEDPLIGKALKGTYRIDRLIAAGGMGAVYEAEHLRLHRRVAVKVLLEQLAKEREILERFVREVEIVAQLGHPHIVQVTDVDRTSTGLPFLVMEYLDGETLERRLARDHHLPLSQAVRICSQVAAALADVHSRQVVHRDLKPANLFLVRAAGEPVFVKVLDFGVSKVAGARRITQAQRIVGTPNYMAPEQARAEVQDHRVDQFSLAAITYEMLSGRAAFPGDDVVAVLHSVLDDEPPPVSDIAPWVPSEIDGVIARALQKDPEQRYPSISRFAWELENAAARAGVGAGRARSERAPGRYRTSFPPERVTPTPGREPMVQSRESVRPGPPTPVPESRRHAAANVTATALYAHARQCFESGAVDQAVRYAEQLLELAVYDKDPAVLRVVGSAITTLDKIFAERVGPPSQVLARGPAISEVRQLKLSPRAAELLSIIDGPMRVDEVLRAAKMPRRDGIRLLAGLLRRGALERRYGSEPPSGEAKTRLASRPEPKPAR